MTKRLAPLLAPLVTSPLMAPPLLARLRQAAPGKKLAAGLCGAALLLLTAAPSFAGIVPSPVLSLDRPGQQQLLEDALNNNWMPTFPEMSDQLSSIMMHQIFGIGAILDAKDQLETQRLLSQLRAEAHKNYEGSEQMCRYGTNVRSLVRTEELSRANKQIFSQVLQHRQALRGNSGSERGNYFDRRNRFDQFRNRYCDPRENNGLLRNPDIPEAHICLNATAGPRVGYDIDFTRLLGSRLTLDVNFTDNVLTDDEQDVIALARNLYAHELPDIRSEQTLTREGNTALILDMRSLSALRSVAHNSFATLVGMKATGSGTVGPFMNRIVEEMGMTGDVAQYLGENPSYYAQMDVLTRKMYQNPVFYTNLYTKPENLKRTGVALQALQIMHDRDRFEASLRREMLLSTLLEMRLREAEMIVRAGVTGRATSTLGQ